MTKPNPKTISSPRSLLHKLLVLAKKELEITLAIAVVLTFVISISFAQSHTLTTTPLQISQVTPDPISSSGSFLIKGKNYSGIAFGEPQAGFYLTNNFKDGPRYKTADGITLINPKETYTLRIFLDQPLGNDTWFLDATGVLEANINHHLVTSSNQGFNLPGVSVIDLEVSGGVTLKSISKVVGGDPTPTSILSSVASLYIAPQNTQIATKTTRQLLAIALDSSGKTINIDGLADWSSSNPNIATVHPKTGEITAISPGTVQITVRANSAQASATITVRSTDPVITVRPTTPVAPTTPTTATIVAPNLFSPETVSQRFIDSGNITPNQSEINQTLSQLPTTSQKLTFQAKSAVQEISATLKEIAFGSTIIDPATRLSVHTPSALEIIRGWFVNLF